VELPARTRIALAWSLWLATIACCPASLAVIWPLTLAVVADAVSLIFLLGYATIGLVVTLRWPANRLAAGRRARWPSGDGGELPDRSGGHVRRAVQVLSIGLMAAGFLLDTSVRRRDRRAGRTSDKNLTSRLPLLLFWIGAVLLVRSSI
jgi:hypothetical protein